MFTKIRETINVFRYPPPLRIIRDAAVLRVLVSVFVFALSLIMLTAPNFIWHSACSQGTQKIAAALAGMTAGYWIA
jgi:hypothetical protein